MQMQEQPQPQPPAPPQPQLQPQQPQQPPASYRPAPTNTLAVVSLISAIVSWFAVPIVGGIVAVITGHMAKREIRRTGEQGDTMATVGLVLGYLHLAVVVLLLGLVLLVFLGVFAFLTTRTVTSG